MTAEEYFKNVYGRPPNNYGDENEIDFAKDFARLKCAEQREICAGTATTYQIIPPLNPEMSTQTELAYTKQGILSAPLPKDLQE